MATITAAQAGNWSDSATWTGGTPPGSGDVAALATFAVTVDQHITVQALTHSAAAGVLVHSSGAFTITVTAWEVNTVNSSHLIRMTGGTANLVGEFLGGTSTSRLAIAVQSGGVATITNATGGSGSNADGVNVESGGVATITGSATASSTAVAANSAGILRVSSDLYSASNGRFPIVGMWGASGEVRIHLRDDSDWPTSLSGGTPMVLSRLGTDHPAEEDVREGVTYGPSGVNEGTLAVPPPTSVASGVPTDDTTGTAALSLSDLAAVTGAQIAAALTPPD